jgi:REP element-mobilizing transposase RayT
MAIRPLPYNINKGGEKLDLPQRKNIRLKSYDYSRTGYYFITICTYERQLLFGNIMGGEMMLNEFGQIVQNEWLKSAEIRKEIRIDKFVVMPNHFHGILIINNQHAVEPYGNTTETGKVKQAVNIDQRRNTSLAKGKNNRTYFHTSLQSPSKNVGAMIRGFKSSVTTKINILRNAPQCPVWQSKY